MSNKQISLFRVNETDVSIAFSDIDNWKIDKISAWGTKTAEHVISDSKGNDLGVLSISGKLWMRINKRLVLTGKKFDISTELGLKQAVRYVYLQTRKPNAPKIV